MAFTLFHWNEHRRLCANKCDSLSFHYSLVFGPFHAKYSLHWPVAIIPEIRWKKSSKESSLAWIYLLCILLILCYITYIVCIDSQVAFLASERFLFGRRYALFPCYSRTLVHSIIMIQDQHRDSDWRKYLVTQEQDCPWFSFAVEYIYK